MKNENIIPKSSLDFLVQLKENNNKPWFEANKSQYLIELNHIENFAGALLKELSKTDVLENTSGKKSVYRIYRDIRFSKDKSPYKAHLGVWLSAGAKGANRSGYYVHIEKGASFISGGFYSPDADELKKVRKEIAFFYDDLQEILNDKNFKKEFGSLEVNDNNSLKNPPRGY